MRPINSMIEFKQIIGRGTRLFEGKDYFTIHDFVKAYEHFSDPEWDGEPAEPETCASAASTPASARSRSRSRARFAVKSRACARKNRARCAGRCRASARRKKRVKVKLADGKERAIQHMMVTTFWHPDGTPMSAQQFMEMLFGKLPDFFKNEDELRELWSDPATRSEAAGRAWRKGFGAEQLAEMQKLIDAEKSDIFDVLAYVAYALSPHDARRAARSRARRDQRPIQHASSRRFSTSSWRST